MTPLARGSTIGILGGGQLGRMLALAAAPLGYRVHIYAPEDAPCAADVAAHVTQASFEDAAALAHFAASVDVITFEFENVPAAAMAACGMRPHFPVVRALEVGQDRVAEKQFAESIGGTTAPWAAVDTRADLDVALAQIGTPSRLKTRRLGYDGKGQAVLRAASDADAAWDTIGGQPAILEQHVQFEREFSVIVARGQDGACVFYDPAENVHRNGILATSSIPAHPDIRTAAVQARAFARRFAERLDYVGVLAIEFFATPTGPIFNEMAPRVHNSGHWTIEGAETSQFENHIRAICGLPLGTTRLRGTQVVMTNLIGDDILTAHTALGEPGRHVHDYGKGVPMPGRKMGHITSVTDAR